MWSALFNRREFFELYLGSTKLIANRVKEKSQVDVDSAEGITLIWEHNPVENFALPSLVIVGDGDVLGLLSAVVAAPQAPSPITALTRVISGREAQQHFDSDFLPLNEGVFPAFAALIFIESVIHGDGRLGVKQLTPLICKRTLTYAWGKGIGARVAAESFLDLPERWLDVYSLLNARQAADTAHRTIDSVIGSLSLLSQLAIGMRPESPAGGLAFELLTGGRESQELAWKRLAECLPRPVAIERLQLLTREERGTYLQEALKTLTSVQARTEGEDIAAACAFLATRLAPGSLEHLDVLKDAGRPELLAWYAMYAALQHPKEIMSLNGGLGFRVLRDLRRVDEKLSAPSADISHSELKIIARAGLEAMAAKIGHASELQVELVPYVVTSFTFQLKNRPRWGEGQQSLDMDSVDTHISPRARLAKFAAELANIARDFPDYSDDSAAVRKSRRKSGQ